MKLILGFTSPFVRKVRITAALKGLASRIELVTKESDPETYQKIRQMNPLNKIPTLMLDNGEVLFDSHVICEYLDSLSEKPRLFPQAGHERYDALRLASLADGLIEAALSIVMERRHRDKAFQLASWIERQQLKIDASLSHLEAQKPQFGSVNYGDITLACALGYLDIRQDGRWRADHPALVDWHQKFSNAVPAYAQTDPAKTD